MLATGVSHDLITTPFGFDSTAAEVIAGVDLSGKRAIVTGGASGIGVETARALADAGAHVTLAVRDTAAGVRVAGEIGGRVDVARSTWPTWPASLPSSRHGTPLCTSWSTTPG